MSRTNRTVLVLIVMGVAAVAALAFLAKRYSAIAPRTEGSSAEIALRDVDRFAEVRKAMAEVLRRHPKAARTAVGELNGVQPEGRTDARASIERLFGPLRVAREEAIRTTEIGPERYAEVREAYGSWKAGKPVEDAELGRALESRRSELEAVDLGELEPIDAMITFGR